MNKISLIALFVLITGCATTQNATETSTEQTAAPDSYINEYPTRDRVDYVLNCVAKHGGLTYITQYACGCKIDKIAEKLSFAEFEAATTFGFMRKTPGENGAAFRDPSESKQLRKRLRAADEYAENQCFVK